LFLLTFYTYLIELIKVQLNGELTFILIKGYFNSLFAFFFRLQEKCSSLFYGENLEENYSYDTKKYLNDKDIMAIFSDCETLCFTSEDSVSMDSTTELHHLCIQITKETYIPFEEFHEQLCAELASIHH